MLTDIVGTALSTIGAFHVIKWIYRLWARPRPDYHYQVYMVDNCASCDEAGEHDPEPVLVGCRNCERQWVA